jgi:hypothetical protein
MNKFLGPEHPETVKILKLLVESFLYDAKIYKYDEMAERGIWNIRLQKIRIAVAEEREAADALWPSREAIIRRYVTTIETPKTRVILTFLSSYIYLVGSWQA